MNESILFKNNYINSVFNYYLQKYLDTTFIPRLINNVKSVNYAYIILFFIYNNKKYFMILSDYQDRINILLENIHTLFTFNLQITPHIIITLKNKNNAYVLTNVLCMLINKIEIYNLQEFFKKKISKNYLYKVIILYIDNSFIDSHLDEIFKLLYNDNSYRFNNYNDINNYLSNKYFIHQTNIIFKK